jgi:SAM-dependent methyltransferase
MNALAPFLEELKGRTNAQEMLDYFDDHLNRMTYSLSKIKPRSEVLEIGAEPFFLSYLLRKTLMVDLQLVCAPPTIWPGEPHEQGPKTVKMGDLQIPACWLNVEKEDLPFEEGTFDYVLCTEVLEHLLYSPSKLLYNIHRVLRTEGELVLSTPNILSFATRLRFIFSTGSNPLPERYSGNGPHFRHNRLYTVDEVVRLLQLIGFKIETVRTITFNGLRVPQWKVVLKSLLEHLWIHSGQTIFVTAKKNGSGGTESYPSWLYGHRPVSTNRYYNAEK